MSQSWMMSARKLQRSAWLIHKHAWEARELRDKIPDSVTEFLPGTRELEIMEDSMLIEQATFLLALAIENMLKGIWVEQNLTLDSKINKIPKEIKNHDLVELADIIKLSMDAEEVRALETLTTHSYWKGRYLVPSDSDKYVNSFNKPGHMLLQKNYPGDVRFPDEIKSIIAKISNLYNDIRRNKKEASDLLPI